MLKPKSNPESNELQCDNIFDQKLEINLVYNNTYSKTAQITDLSYTQYFSHFEQFGNYLLAMKTDYYPTGMYVINITDILSPEVIYLHDLVGGEITFTMKDTVAIIADYNGLLFVDFSDILNPVNLGEHTIKYFTLILRLFINDLLIYF
ncbi:MAG: hypothetical protein FK734_16765 [Asgard group archaeon]|nr:hypothetical protein [Asgard group archaeon]